ncbi:hypothetical protein SLE2022_045110 [Rubroshorea leprosula]
MSLKNRTPPSPPPSPPDLKHRVITCLNKLADRDTLALAAAELESIARNLTQDCFSPFLNCIHNTDDSSKSPVRRQCVGLLTLLSHSHGNSLSPHVSKMISTVARRLRDSDSAVRSACVEATTAMSSQITKPPFSVLSKPLIELLVVEQDVNSQIGAAMCLAAAIEAAPNPDAEQLRKVLPRLGKLVKSDGFKAKAAAIGVIGSVVGVGGAGSKGVLDWVVPCIVEFLSSEDWTARKAAAEALGKVAVAEKELAPGYKAPCLKVLENRRFDKVKVVRETMNRTLELWKEVPGLCEDVPLPSQSKSSPKDDASIGCFPSVAKNSNVSGFQTPRPKKAVPTSRSPLSNTFPVTNIKNESLLNCTDRNSSSSMSSKLDLRKPSACKLEIVEPKSPSSKGQDENIKRIDHGVMESEQNGDNQNHMPETKQVPFSKTRDEKVQKFGSLRSGSRVVPYHDDEILDVGISNASEVACENSKDIENLSMIHEQLAQIENQQSSLFDLLQKFIGSSQSGIHSLETRVNGLEMALDEISYDLAVSSGRFPNTDSAGNTCCKLPGTEFFSPKFWRKTEARFSTSRFSFSGCMHSLNGVHNTPNKHSGVETDKQVFQRFQHQSRDEFSVGPLVNVCSEQRENSGYYLNRISKSMNQDGERVQVFNASISDGAPPVTCTASVNLSRR